MNAERYNGYTNYETWLYKLHCDDNAYVSMASEYESVGDYANWLKEQAEQAIEDIENLSLLNSDLLKAALAKVNFYELAKGWYQVYLEDNVWLSLEDTCLPCYFRGSSKITFAVMLDYFQDSEALARAIEEAVQSCDAGQWDITLGEGVKLKALDISLLCEITAKQVDLKPINELYQSLEPNQDDYPYLYFTLDYRECGEEVE